MTASSRLRVLPVGCYAPSLGRLLAIGAGLVIVGFGVGVSWPHLLTRVPVVDSSREEPSRQRVLGVEFRTYFERGARLSAPLT